MTNYIFPQSGDLDDAASFSWFGGRTNASDYVEFGLGLTVDFSVPEVSVGSGKAFIILSQEEADSDPGTYRTRTSKGAEYDGTTSPIALQSNATNYVYLRANVGIDSGTSEDDLPYIETNTTGTSPGEDALLIGVVDTSNDTSNETNRAPNGGFETLLVTDGLTLEDDLALTGENAGIEVGDGDGPHEVAFGSDTTDQFVIGHDTSEDNLTIDWGGTTLFEFDGPAGDAFLPDGSLTIGENIQFASSSGTALDLRPNSDGSHYLWRHDDGTASPTEYGAQSHPAADEVFWLRDESANLDLFGVGTDGTVTVPAGPLDMSDQPMVSVEDIEFFPDTHQALKYGSASGDFEIRDEDNGSERVLRVGQGQMTFSRNLNALSGMTLNKQEVDDGGVIRGEGGSINYDGTFPGQEQTSLTLRSSGTGDGHIMLRDNYIYNQNPDAEAAQFIELYEGAGTDIFVNRQTRFRKGLSLSAGTTLDLNDSPVAQAKYIGLKQTAVTEAPTQSLFVDNADDVYYKGAGGNIIKIATT